MKNILCVFVLFTFLVLIFSCYSTGEKSVETITSWNGKKVSKVKVLSLTKKSGKEIVFRENYPGKIVKGGIEGEGSAPSKKIELNQSDIREIIRRKNGSIQKIVLKDNQIIEPVYAVEEDDKIIVYDSETVFVPFSGIQSVWVTYFDMKTTLLMTAGILGVILVRYFNSY